LFSSPVPIVISALVFAYTPRVGLFVTTSALVAALGAEPIPTALITGLIISASTLAYTPRVGLFVTTSALVAALGAEPITTASAFAAATSPSSEMSIADESLFGITDSLPRLGIDDSLFPRLEIGDSTLFGIDKFPVPSGIGDIDCPSRRRIDDPAFPRLEIDAILSLPSGIGDIDCPSRRRIDDPAFPRLEMDAPLSSGLPSGFETLFFLLIVEF
jgi:hypothetical protein